MRIAGIDPDTKAIQIVVLDDGGPNIYRLQAAGRRAEDRIQALAALLEDSPVIWQGVRWVYVETPVLAQFRGKTNAKALRDQAQVVGIIRSYLWRRKIDHSLIDNTIWKKGLLGGSNASKEEIAAYAQKVLGVPADQPQDAYDAACIAAWGCNNVPPKGE
jgi:Holliday junction resolvasome RuvABC endonuclease subunit